MNKSQIMRQPSMEAVLVESVNHQPGITSALLFETAKEWAGRHWDASDTAQFESILGRMRDIGFRCTDKQWYPKGHVAERKQEGPSKEDPRQTRMFG